MIVNLGQFTPSPREHASMLMTLTCYATALGVLTLTALGSAKPGDDLILATVTVRFKYYLVLTFCLNIICAGEHLTGVHERQP